MILFTAAGQTFAIAAAAVDEIRTIEGLRPTPLRGKVHAILDRGAISHYVVDAAAHFRLPAVAARHVLLLRHSVVALGIDAVDRMTAILRLHALPRAFAGEERRWYRGLALVEGRVVPVVDPEAFLTRAELAALAVEGAATA